MSAPRDKMKSMAKSFLVSVASATATVLSRDAALSTLGIDTKNDEYHVVIGKLAAEIVKLREEIEELQREAGTR